MKFPSFSLWKTCTEYYWFFMLKKSRKKFIPNSSILNSYLYSHKSHFHELNGWKSGPMGLTVVLQNFRFKTTSKTWYMPDKRTLRQSSSNQGCLLGNGYGPGTTTVLGGCPYGHKVNSPRWNWMNASTLLKKDRNSLWYDNP